LKSTGIAQRSSSHELVELEEAQHQQRLVASLQQYDNLSEDELLHQQNSSSSSSSEDEGDLEILSASDTDSSISGPGVTCGVEDALLAITVQSKRTTKPNENDTTTLDTLSGASSITVLTDDDYSPKKKKKRLFSRFRRQQRQDTVPAVFDLEQYMIKREMSVTQEKWNALTVLPNPAYCIYFLLSAQWLTQAIIDNADGESIVHNDTDNWITGGCFDSYNVLSFWKWHSMPSLPPLPVLAVAIGICLHAPWSFLYHWTYAHTMSATQRTKHWSRRMDQSMIHVASAFLSYGSSGSANYLFANVLYNMDCVRRQFRPIVRPKRNQMRIFISIIAYTLPLLKRGEYTSFLHLWILFMISGWFFVQYPVGGWSHAVFHIIIAFVPPLLMRTATQLPASAPQLHMAAFCAAATATTN
jgi:hypothetical protein